MRDARVLRLAESLALATLFTVAYRFPGAWGGWLEPLAALAFPFLLLLALLRGRHAFWTWLALTLGVVVIYAWVPHTLATKGDLPPPLAFLGAFLLSAWEATGLWVVALAARAGNRWKGPWGAALAAALTLLAWESWGFHVYPWTWGATLGALPWTARAAAFLSASGLSALTWGVAAGAAATLAARRPLKRVLAGPLVGLLLLLTLSAAWRLLPREAPHTLDIALVQPNFVAGQRRPGMEEELWRRSDALLQSQGLPRAGRATLLLWPESAVLGRDDRGEQPRLRAEAARRGVAWLYGTEGGPYNLVRGEAPGAPSFLFAKTEPMPFGERMPGPPAVQRWLDGLLGFASQEAVVLAPGCAFPVPTPQGPVRVHPLICSEALLAGRSRAGRELAQADLLTNHTNDGWFEGSIATDLHAAQIRLRAPELGVPLVRVTLTGKSGLFREDGRFELWGEPMTEAARAFELTWRPIRTPARSPWLLPLLLSGLALGLLLAPRRR